MGETIVRLYEDRDAEGVAALFARNNFTPTLPNNQVHSQGYFGEIQAFVEAVEGRKADVASSLDVIKDTYGLIESLNTHVPA